MNRLEKTNSGETEKNSDCGCGNRGSRPGDRISLARVRQRLDELQDQGDLQGAERMLDYWLKEAGLLGDEVGEIEIENEYIGFFRKAGEGKASLQHAERALFLVRQAGLENSVTEATTQINSATAYLAFQKPERAWELFCEAKKTYEAQLQPEDGRLAGLWNNMGLAASELGKYREAEDLYAHALEIMTVLPGGEGDAAITCLNLADAVFAEAEDSGSEEEQIRATERIDSLIEKAWALLQSPELPRDSYDRFVCGKCAPVFGYYGYLDYERRLEERSRRPEEYG